MPARSRSKSRRRAGRGGRRRRSTGGRGPIAVARSLWHAAASVVAGAWWLVVTIVGLPAAARRRWRRGLRRVRGLGGRGASSRRAARRLRRARRWRPRLPIWGLVQPSRPVAGSAILAGALLVGFSQMDRVTLPGARTATHRSVTALPALPVIPIEHDGVPLASYLRYAELTEAQRDEFLTSPVLADPEFAEAVHWWIGYWTGTGSQWFPGFLDRMAWLGSMVDSALALHDLPPSLRYLPLIESGYDPRVTSRARAVGLWQLMPVTARGLGLKITPLLDERRDPERSTEAALTFLDDLHGEFESWFLTLAAYNSGPTRVRGILRRHAPEAPRTDSLYWALRDHFPAETREFLPKLYGAMWVASRPDAYGFTAPPPGGFSFDAVSVPDQTTLDVVARAADVPHEDVLWLNPQLLRGITPPGERMRLRVPQGQGRAFDLNYPRIPPSARVTFVEHVVQSGETLSEIAARYRVASAEIEAANPRVRARSLQVGARLTVPVAPEAGAEGSRQ